MSTNHLINNRRQGHAAARVECTALNHDFVGLDIRQLKEWNILQNQAPVAIPALDNHWLGRELP